jgi:tetratricopeptide (TPR) repeat protein
MRTCIYILACFLISFFFGSCKQDKGNESMPANKVDGSYEPQLNYLNQSIEEDPDDDELLSKRARLFLNIYRYPEALNDIKKAVEINSNNGEYYLLLSQVSFVMRNYYECIKAAEKAEGLGVDNPELPILQARVYWETGDTSRSNIYKLKADQITPFHSDLTLLKGKQAASKGDSALAVTCFLSSIKTDSRNVAAYRNIIRIYLNKGNDDSALFYTLKAREINPHNPDLYYAEGRIYQKKDMKQSALLSYKNCVKTDSLYAPALLQLGYLYFKESNFNEALNYFSRYVKLDNDNKEVYRHLITILNSFNREHATIPYYERLVQLDSTNVGLKYTLQNLYKLYSVEIKPDTTAQVSSNVPPVIIRRDTLTRRRNPVRRDSTSRLPVASDSIK